MPRPPRFFITPEQVTAPHIIIAGEDVRHIVTVLRMKIGEELLLCDGQGNEYRVRITALGRTAVTTEIVGQEKHGIRLPRITLGQGLPKSDKMDFIVQKATELGVSRIVPLVTERTIVKVKDEEKRTSRWQKIAREAAMQSNRPDIPKVDAVIAFKDFLRTLNPEAGTLLLLSWEEGREPVKNVLRRQSGVQTIVVLVGPEGGFSTAEAELARAKGFHPVSLGPNILRTETAALAVLSMIGYEFHQSP
jgi:16S rRNA (uracil1498-N3)-methyltransferase